MISKRHKCVCGRNYTGNNYLCIECYDLYGNNPKLWPKEIRKQYLEINSSKSFALEDSSGKDESLHELWEEWPTWLQWQEADRKHKKQIIGWF